MTLPIPVYSGLFPTSLALIAVESTGFVSASTSRPVSAPLQLSTDAWRAVQVQHWNNLFVARKKESVQDLRAVVDKMSRLTDDVFFHILSLICGEHKTVEFGLLLEQAFGTPDFSRRVPEALEALWRLEADFLNGYREPAYHERDSRREAVARYLGVVPSERPAGKSLAARYPDEAEALFDAAERDPERMRALYAISQISAFLNREGKTRYTKEPSSLVEYLLDGRADCETGSFLFSHLASLIRLPVSLGRSSNHCFLYAAGDSLVVECTAFYNLRPAKKYLAREKAHYGREPKASDRNIARIFRDRLANLWIAHSGRITLSQEIRLLRLLHRFDPEAFERAMTETFLEGLRIFGAEIERG